MSTSPSAVSRPQWPWSVYSSRQSSAMSTSASPTSSRSVRNATCTTPSGASACEPRGVLVARDAEQHDRGHAEVGERAHFLAQALLRVLHDARHRDDGLGRVDALLHEQRGDEVVDAQPVLGDEPAQRRGTAQPAQAVFGERHAIDGTRRCRRGPAAERRRTSSRARPSTRPSMVCGSASASTRSPRSRAVCEVTGPIEITDGRRRRRTGRPRRRSW